MQNTAISLTSLLLTLGVALAPAAAASRVAVVVGPDAPSLERKAAEQLAGYLRTIRAGEVSVTESPRDAEYTFLVGSPATNPAVMSAEFGVLPEQGIRVLTRAGGRHMVVGGGSPAATMWAVSEVAEHLGFRFTLSRDLAPLPRGRFRMPRLDVRKQPVFPVRTWRLVNDFAYGMEGWGLRDYQILLDQLAKLRFNRVLVNIYPWQPFLDLQAGKIRRSAATLWYGYRYPITADMIGRNLFGDEPVFRNPDVPLDRPYPELLESGQRLIRGAMAYAKGLGMEVALTATLTDYPEEFAPLLPGAKRIHQLGGMDIVPGPDVPPDHPALIELASSVVKTSLETYPDTDLLAIVMPEHRDWVDQFDRAWEALDRRYGISAVATRESLLAAARKRKDYPGGAERAVAEVRGDLAALYFCDLLFRERKLLDRESAPPVRLLYSNLAEEVYPILERVLPPGAEMVSFIDYTPARVWKRKAVLEQIPPGVPTALYYTFQDDNIGLFPQLTTGTLANLAATQRSSGWAGFVARNWITFEAEPSALWAARASWSSDWTPEQAYTDYGRALCGHSCSADLVAAFQEIEKATETLEWQGLGFAFPIPDMMTKQWKPEPFPAELEPVAAAWMEARSHLQRAAKLASPQGKRAVEWWLARVDFALSYLDSVRHMRSGAIAEAAGDRKLALECARQAHVAASRGISRWANVAADQSDRGAIALLNEYVERPLRMRVAKLRDLSH